MKTAQTDRLKERAMDWEKSFTFPVSQLTFEEARMRVLNAWLAGYAAGKQASIKRRSKSDRGAAK
jgi:hypothetical protein